MEFGLSSATLSGDVITLDWNGEPPGTPDTTYAATFDLTGSSPLPGPASLALLASRLAGLAALRRRRRR